MGTESVGRPSHSSGDPSTVNATEPVGVCPVDDTPVTFARKTVAVALPATTKSLVLVGASVVVPAEALETGPQAKPAVAIASPVASTLRPRHNAGNRLLLCACRIHFLGGRGIVVVPPRTLEWDGPLARRR